MREIVVAVGAVILAAICGAVISASMPTDADEPIKPTPAVTETHRAPIIICQLVGKAVICLPH